MSFRLLINSFFVSLSVCLSRSLGLFPLPFDDRLRLDTTRSMGRDLNGKTNGNNFFMTDDGKSIDLLGRITIVSFNEFNCRLEKREKTTTMMIDIRQLSIKVGRKRERETKKETEKIDILLLMMLYCCNYFFLWSSLYA